MFSLPRRPTMNLILQHALNSAIDDSDSASDSDSIPSSPTQMPQSQPQSQQVTLSLRGGGLEPSQVRRRRYSAEDGLRTATQSSYPFRSQDADRDSLSTLDEEPSRDPRDTSAPTPSSTTQSAADTSDAVAAGPDYLGLSWPSTGTRDRLEATEEQAAARQKKLVGAVRTILECVGEDVNREGLLKTPERYAQAMMYFTKGYEQNLRDIVNGAIFNENHDEMVIVKDIEVMSMCEHHLVPFTGRMHIGYIPAGRVLGLSKFARIADMFSRRLQVQERLTKQVAHAINEVLTPQGVAVVVESSHLCMVMRGVQQTQSRTTTSCMLGALRSRDRTRAEFLTLIRQ